MNRNVLGMGLVLTIVGAAACAAAGRGTAVIKATPTGGALSGTATLTETPKGLQVVIAVKNAPPGVHGLHIHEHGDCGDVGKAAGGHFNPDHHPHGNAVAHGIEHAHAGDLGNITIDAKGSGNLTVTVKGLTLKQGPRAVAGKAIILHEKADDFGQPVGNAGGRIACGVINAGN